MIGERPTGRALCEELRVAAQKAGVPLKRFVGPLVTSTSSSFLASLARAEHPLQLTVDRVRALIAGLPIPDPRESNFKGCYGRHDRQHAVEPAISGEIIAARRDLVERAHAERLPGETIAAAVKRLAANPGGKLYESTLASVRYVFGRPIAFPFRKNFKSAGDHQAELKRLWHAREAVEADEWVRARRRMGGAD